MCLYVNIIKINWYIIWNKVVKLVGSMVYYDVIWNWLLLIVIYVILL